MNTQIKYYLASCAAVAMVVVPVVASVFLLKFAPEVVSVKLNPQTETVAVSRNSSHKNPSEQKIKSPSRVGGPEPKTLVSAYLASRFSSSNYNIGRAIDYLHVVEKSGLPAFALAPLMTEQLNLGRFKEALKTAQKIQSLSDDSSAEWEAQDYLTYGYSIPAPLILATDAMAQSKYKQAAQILQAKPVTLIDTIAYTFLVSWAYAGQGDMARALATMEPYYDSREIGSLARLQASYMASHLGDYERAYALLTPIKTPSMDVYQQQLSMLVYLQRWQQGRALLFKMQNMGIGVDSAVTDALRDSTAIDHQAPTPQARMSRVFLEMSNSLSQSDAKLGLIYGQLSRMTYPPYENAPEMLAYVAGLLGQMGAVEDAIYKLKAANLDTPENLPLAVQLVRLYEKQEAYESALEVLASLQQTYDCDHILWEHKGDIFNKQKEYRAARKAYGQAIDCLPSPDAPSAWVLYFKRADTYNSTKEWDKIEPDLLHAQSLSPENSVLLNYLGYTWIEQGKNTKQALDMVRQSLALNPKSGAAIDSLGWAYYKLGRYAEAVQTLEKSAKIETTDPVVTDHLGDAYWQVGRKREARYQWQRVLDLHADNDRADDVIASVRKKLKQGLIENQQGNHQP